MPLRQVKEPHLSGFIDLIQVSAAAAGSTHRLTPSAAPLLKKRGKLYIGGCGWETWVPVGPVLTSHVTLGELPPGEPTPWGLGASTGGHAARVTRHGSDCTLAPVTLEGVPLAADGDLAKECRAHPVTINTPGKIARSQPPPVGVARLQHCRRSRRFPPETLKASPALLRCQVGAEGRGCPLVGRMPQRPGSSGIRVRRRPPRACWASPGHSLLSFPAPSSHCLSWPLVLSCSFSVAENSCF